MGILFVVSHLIEICCTKFIHHKVFHYETHSKQSGENGKGEEVRMRERERVEWGDDLKRKNREFDERLRIY